MVNRWRACGLVLSVVAMTLGLTNGAASANPRHSSAAPGPIHLAAGPAWRGLLPTTISKGKVARTVVIDGGALVISPPPLHARQVVGVTKATGEVEAATSASTGTVDPSGVALGSVHLSPPLRKIVRVGTRELAWVAVIDPSSAVSCPMVAGSPEPPQPSFRVVVIAASGRTALVYTSLGTGECGGPIHPPSVAIATEVVSIPWHGLATSEVSTSPPRYMWQISYQLPRCGVFFDSGVVLVAPGSPALYIQTMVPVIPPSTCATPKAITTTWGPESVPVSEADHGAIGIHQY